MSREITENYAGELLKLSKILMMALSLSLGLEEIALENAFGKEVGTCMRVNYYPKCPQPELALGLGSHSDPGGITILLPDHVKGLQVCKHGEWLTVEPVPHALIFMIGDQIQVHKFCFSARVHTHTHIMTKLDFWSIYIKKFKSFVLASITTVKMEKLVKTSNFLCA